MKLLTPDAIDRGARVPRTDARDSPTASTPWCGPSPPAPPGRRQLPRVHRPRRRGSRRPHRRDLRDRGGPADPPRRAPGRPGVRPAAAARRRRWRVDRTAHRRVRRDARGAQPEARRRAPHRPLLPWRQGRRRRRSRPAATTSAASSSTSTATSPTHGFDVAVASSGTRRDRRPASCTPVQRRRAAADVQLLRVHPRRSSTTCVDELVKHRTPSARTKVPGLEANRADIIVAGALILSTIAETFGIESFTYSEAALREGVLLDTMSRLARPCRPGGAGHAPPARRVAPEHPPARRPVRRRPGPLDPRRRRSPSRCSTRSPSCATSARRPGSTSRPAPCSPTSGSSSPTASTTSTPTT